MFPLLRNEIEILHGLLNRRWIELEPVLTAATDTTNDSGILQYTQVLGNCLARQAGALS